MEQDLKWQNDHEHDSLNKSEDPAEDYMNFKDLCKRCHAPLQKGQCAHCDIAKTETTLDEVRD